MSSSRRHGIRIFVFDDVFSIFHFILGFITKLFSVLGLWIVSTIILFSFIVYEIVEQEGKYFRFGDFIEFIMGYLLGDITASGVLH